MKRLFQTLIICTGLIFLCLSGYGQVISLVKDINPTGGSFPQHMVPFGNKLAFSAFSNFQYDLWITDGTEHGTYMIDVDTNIESEATPIASCNGKLFFTVTANPMSAPYSLYVTDGSASGTFILPEVTTWSEFPTAVINNKLYFMGRNDTSGNELWVSDGTISGTYMVKDIFPGTPSGVQDLILFKGLLYLKAKDSHAYSDLWISDGTEQGTQIFKDIDLHNGSDWSFLINNDLLYFPADDNTTPYPNIEPWATDGTIQGTYKVADINPTWGSMPKMLSACSDEVYMIVGPSTPQTDWLAITDGTDINTHVLQKFWSLSAGACLNGKYYFPAEDTMGVVGLWTSDGTANGTQMLVSPSFVYSPFAGSPVNFKDRLIFMMDDGSNGIELWISDGTVEGTYKPVFPNASGFGPMDDFVSGMIAFNGDLYFSARYNSTNHELWKLSFWPASVQTISNASSSAFTLSPNPATDHINITAAAPSTLRIHDMLGRLILRQPVSGKQSVDISSLLPGVYTATIAGNNYTARFIKQ